MRRTRLIVFTITIFVTVTTLNTRRMRAEEHHPTPVSFTEVGRLEAIKGGEFQFGGRDRIYVIEDQWEWDKTSRLLPKLPEVDLESESLLVVTSWQLMERAIKSIVSENDTLVVEIDQEKPPTIYSGPYRPPTYLVAKLPRWQGPIRFEVNGEEAFTMLRGQALADFSYTTWEEFLRLHSGGMPSGTLLKRYWKRQWPDATDEQLMEKLSEYRQNYRHPNPAPYYPLLMQDLVDARARDAVPRIFKLFEAMGEHDKAMQPAVDAIIALSGPDLVEHCRRSLESDNRRSRNAAMGFLSRFEIAEARNVAYPRLADADIAMCSLSLNYLRKIGLRQEDGPHLVKALNELEERAHHPPPPNPRTSHWNWGFVSELIDAIVSLDELPPDARESIERIADSFPFMAVQKHAAKALKELESVEIEGTN